MCSMNVQIINFPFHFLYREDTGEFYPDFFNVQSETKHEMYTKRLKKISIL